MALWEGMSQQEVQAQLDANPEAKAKFSEALSQLPQFQGMMEAEPQGQLVTAGGSNTGIAQGVPIWNHNTNQYDIVGGNQGGLDPSTYQQTHLSTNVATGEQTVTMRDYKANQGMGSLTEQQQHDLYYGNTPLSGAQLVANSQQTPQNTAQPSTQQQSTQGMLTGGPLGNSETNPYMAGMGVENTYVNSKGHTVARMADGSQHVVTYADGTNNTSFVDAYRTDNIYDQGTTYETGMQDSTRNKRVGGKNEEIGVFNRPDVTGTEYEGAYLPGRPDNATDMQAYHQYYMDNPQLRSALSPDEQVELLWMDKETGNLDTSLGSYKDQQYDLRKGFGLPRKTGFKGMDSGWEWDYDLQARGKDPYEMIVKKGGNIGGYVDKDRPGGSLFQEGMGEIMNGIQYLVDKSAGSVGIKGVKAEDVIQVVATALGAGPAVSGLLSGTAGAAASSFAGQAAAEIGRQTATQAAIDQATKAAVDYAIETGVDWNNPDDVKQVVDNIEVDLGTLTDGEDGPMIGDTPVQSRPGWHWERDGDSWKAVPDEDPETEITSDDSPDSGGSTAPTAGGPQATAPEAGEVVTANVILNDKESPEAWRHTNPDGSVVAGDGMGDVWEVEPAPEPTDEPEGSIFAPFYATGAAVINDALSTGPGDIGEVTDVQTNGQDATTTGGTGPGTSTGTGDGDQPGDSDGDGEGSEGDGPGAAAAASGLLAGAGSPYQYKPFMAELEAEFPMLAKLNLQPVDYLRILMQRMKG